MKLYKFSCKCGREIETPDKNAVIRCKCRRTMVNTNDMHPIAFYRFKYDLTQAELASLLGFNRTILARIERKSYNTTEDQKIKIKRITGITL